PHQEIDVRRFEMLVDEGTAFIEAGDPERALPALRQALALAGGEPYADLDGWDPGRAEASRLAELRRLAEERTVDALLGAGLQHDAVAAAAATASTAQAEQEPLRERRWAT